MPTNSWSDQILIFIDYPPSSYQCMSSGSSIKSSGSCDNGIESGELTSTWVAIFSSITSNWGFVYSFFITLAYLMTTFFPLLIYIPLVGLCISTGAPSSRIIMMPVFSPSIVSNLDILPDKFKKALCAGIINPVFTE